MQRLGELGATVIDGDLVYREMTGPGSTLVQCLAAAFGEQIVSPDGSLNRPALGKIVFADPAALQKLDQLTHPAIVAEVLRRLDATSTAVAATEGIKLLESGLGDRCDEIWIVICEPEQQRARLMRRNGMSPAEADRRISMQAPISEKLDRADVVIQNNGTVAELQARVDRAWMESARKRGDGGY